MQQVAPSSFLRSVRLAARRSAVSGNRELWDFESSVHEVPWWISRPVAVPGGRRIARRGRRSAISHVAKVCAEGQKPLTKLLAVSCHFTVNVLDFAKNLPNDGVDP